MTAKLAIKGNRDAEVSFIVRQRNVNVAMQSKWGLFEAGRSELSGINAPLNNMRSAWRAGPDGSSRVFPERMEEFRWRLSFLLRQVMMLAFWKADCWQRWTAAASARESRALNF